MKRVLSFEPSIIFYRRKPFSMVDLADFEPLFSMVGGCAIKILMQDMILSGPTGLVLNCHGQGNLSLPLLRPSISAVRIVLSGGWRALRPLEIAGSSAN